MSDAQARLYRAALDGAEERIAELKAENKRLRELLESVRLTEHGEEIRTEGYAQGLEDAAKVCDERESICINEMHTESAICAAAIRALKEKT